VLVDDRVSRGLPDRLGVPHHAAADDRGAHGGGGRGYRRAAADARGRPRLNPLLRERPYRLHLAAHHLDLAAYRFEVVVQRVQLLGERVVRGPGGGRDVLPDVRAQQVDLVEDGPLQLGLDAGRVGPKHDRQANEDDGEDGEHRCDLERRDATADQYQQCRQRSQADPGPEDHGQEPSTSPTLLGLRGRHG
jgi:hypothetical protein